jgi:NTE family protein
MDRMSSIPLPQVHRERCDLAATGPTGLPDRSCHGVALALGGGFARGFAHLGVLEVLQQAKIPVVAIVGTSIGSLLGAAYADGVSVAELCEFGSRISLRNLIRSRQRASGSSGAGPIAGFVREYLRSRQVEQLPIPTSIVATDLSTGAPHVFSRGSLEVALRASCAFPGLFQPVAHEGKFLADGCIAAQVPSAIAAQMGATCVLAVGVGTHDRPAVSRRDIIRVRESASFDLAANPTADIAWMQDADLSLQPGVGHIGWMDFSRVSEAYHAGAEATHMALPRIRGLLLQSKCVPAPILVREAVSDAVR